MEEKTFSQVFNLNKRLGKILIAGDEGAGKTYLSIIIAVEKMLRGIVDCWKSYEKVDEYNALGYKFSKNYEHLAFANHDINCLGTKIPSFSSYTFDPFRVGLHSPDYNTDLFPPGATLFCTEAHMPFNAYMWQYVRPEVTAFWTTSRQYDISLVMDTNRPNMVVNTIRELCNRILYLYKEVEEIKKGNIVVGHRFYVLEFKSNGSFTTYLKTGKKENCEEYVLKIDTCRYQNYDTEMCRYLHLKGREIEDFCIKHFDKIQSLEDVEKFAESFGSVIPEGYYIKPGAKVKEKEKNEEVPEMEEDVF